MHTRLPSTLKVHPLLVYVLLMMSPLFLSTDLSISKFMILTLLANVCCAVAFCWACMSPATICQPQKGNFIPLSTSLFLKSLFELWLRSRSGLQMLHKNSDAQLYINQQQIMTFSNKQTFFNMQSWTFNIWIRPHTGGWAMTVWSSPGRSAGKPRRCAARTAQCRWRKLKKGIKKGLIKKFSSHLWRKIIPFNLKGRGEYQVPSKRRDGWGRRAGSGWAPVRVVGRGPRSSSSPGRTGARNQFKDIWNILQLISLKWMFHMNAGDRAEPLALPAGRGHSTWWLWTPPYEQQDLNGRKRKEEVHIKSKSHNQTTP